jgi:hypothetical protein
MRTTLNVDDDVLEFAKSLAGGRQISVGQALSELARRGISTPLGMKKDAVSGFWTFETPAEAPKFGLEEVQRALDQEDLEYAKYFRKP